MTREEFVHHMGIVEQFDSDGDALSTALGRYLKTGDRPIIGFGAHLLTAHLDLIESAMGDTANGKETCFGSWTRWYLYYRPEDGRCVVGGTHYKVENASDLYDVIEAWKQTQHQ